MKPKEALNYLKGIVGEGSMDWAGGPIRTEVLVAAIEALEKNVPYRPDVYSYGDADGYPVLEYQCPSCALFLDESDSYNYCPYCGQALDWEDEE